MKIEIIEQTLRFNIYGFSGTIINQNYGQTGVALMDKMWAVVKGMKLKNKGTNIWVYETMIMTAGVELENPPPAESGLINRKVELSKYAYWKHVGPYDQLMKVNADMRAELESMKIKYQYPCLEIYGHHVDGLDPETEVIWAIQ